MKKFFVSVFASSLIFLSYLGLVLHNYYVQVLMNFNESFSIIRFVTIIILLSYAFVPIIRTKFTKSFLSIAGFFLLGLGVVTLLFPTILGSSEYYILIGDALTLIEAGILALVLSFELPARKTVFIPSLVVLIKTRLTARRSVYNQLIATSSLKSKQVGFFDKIVLDGNNAKIPSNKSSLATN